MAIQLITFGGLRAVNATGELRELLGQHTRAALLVYLAVERRVSRELLTTVFWPESDTENARHALRQSLYHLRKVIGGDWVESLAHELVVADDVRADAHEFTLACERRDHAATVDLYHGPFLDGIHLVDLQPWEAWVDARRTQYARAFRVACRDLMDTRRSAGDLPGVVRVAERWVERDPTDAEAQHRLVEALAHAGETTEAIRQYETYARSLEADGAEPATETRTLADRIRVAAPSLPPPAPAPMTLAASQPPDVRHATAASTPRRSLRSRWALVAAAGIVAASLWAWRHDTSPPEAVSQARTTIAVLPFDVRGGTDAAFLREGMVSLLATALDGAGELRATDTRATLAVLSETSDSAPALARADRIARRLDASMFVLGNVVEAGGRVQIEAAVYDVTAGCGGAERVVRSTDECGSAAPVARAAVTGATDSIFAVVDVLAARLLGGLGNPSTDRLRETASLTTGSLPAFKDYLRGEALMRHGQFERAAESYVAALRHDSTFAVAHYRLALAREWAPLPGEDSAAAAASRHASRLATRDRNLLDAFRQWRFGDATNAERAYRSILARYPEDIDAWFQLGEILFHHGPLLGRPIAESEEAWRRVLSYEPRNLFAITHLARIALADRRLSTVDSLLALFDAHELRTDRRLVEIELSRAVARRDTAGALGLTRVVRQWEPFAVWRTAAFLTSFAPEPTLMRRVIEDLTVDFPDPSLRADLYWFASQLDLAAGDVARSEVARSRAVESERKAGAWRRTSYEDVTTWYAATLPLPYDDSWLTRVRREATARPQPASDDVTSFVNELRMGTPIQVEPLRQYVIGILSVRLRDTSAVAVAADSLQRLAASRSATALVRDLDRGLRAQLAHLRGDPEDALRLLESLELRDSQGDVAVTPFVTRVNERVLHGDVLAALGRPGEAERWFASLGAGSVTEIALGDYAASRRRQIRWSSPVARQ